MCSYIHSCSVVVWLHVLPQVYGYLSQHTLYSQLTTTTHQLTTTTITSIILILYNDTRSEVWHCMWATFNVHWRNVWARIFSTIRRMPVSGVPKPLAAAARLKLPTISTHLRREKRSLKNPNRSSSRLCGSNVFMIRRRIRSSMWVSIRDWIRMKIPTRVDSSHRFVRWTWNRRVFGYWWTRALASLLAMHTYFRNDNAGSECNLNCFVRRVTCSHLDILLLLYPYQYSE